MIVGLPVLTPASRWFRLLRIESRFAFSTAHLLCQTFHPRNGLRFIPNLDPNMATAPIHKHLFRQYDGERGRSAAATAPMTSTATLVGPGMMSSAQGLSPETAWAACDGAL